MGAGHRRAPGVPVAVLPLAALLGCATWLLAPDEREILSAPPSARHRVLIDATPERRLDLYLLAMRRIEPPDLSLAEDVAASGPQLLPPLIDRLAVADDAGKQDLVWLLFVGRREGHWTPSAEQLERARTAVDAMRDDALRDSATSLLARVLEAQPPLRP